MRYVSSAAVMAIVLFFTSTAVYACDMRREIREEIRNLVKARIADLDVDVDIKRLEDKIHDEVHAAIKNEERRLEREKDRLEQERKRLERERKRLEDERKKVARRNRGDGGNDDDSGLLLALGLYGIGVGALFVIGRRPKRGNAE